MRFTNIHSLPSAMVAALSDGWAPKVESLSVTALIGPPRIRTLTMEHWDSMEEDVSSRLWALLGQGLHATLASYAANREVLVEQAIKQKVDSGGGSIIVSGRPDSYESGVINDYKITSVFSFLLGDKPEWEYQLNTYAFLYRGAGFPVTGLNIQAILRDWVESKTLIDANYPKIPFLTVPIPLWTAEDAAQYVMQRVDLHLTHPMNPCSDAERWARPDTYAVFKKSGKRALRVLDTLEEAQKWGADHHAEKPKDDLEIQKRKGSFVRCERFCAVRKFCDCNPYVNPAQAESQNWEEMT